jgi:Ca-activated chloride channel family protein
MLEFDNIEFLLGLLILLPLIALFILTIRWKVKVRKALGDERLVQSLTKNYAETKYRSKVIMVLIAIAAGCVAAANLRKPIVANGNAGVGIDVMIALDVSKSMLGQDVKPTRLDRAKQLIGLLSEQLENNRIGFVVFAGQAYLQMPLTSDASATKMFVNNATPEMVSVQGTSIGDALATCDGGLDVKEKKAKAVVLITDGEDQDDKAMDAAKTLAEHGTILYTVGVGSVEGVPIIDPTTNEYKRDKNGQTVITKLNEELLKQLAKEGNGSYHHMDDVNQVAAALTTEMNAMEKKPLNKAGFTEYQSYFPFFIAAAVLLLIVETFISERKKKVA